MHMSMPTDGNRQFFSAVGVFVAVVNGRIVLCVLINNESNEDENNACSTIATLHFVLFAARI